MRLYLLLLLIVLPCVVLYLLYGRAYLWAYRSARWGDLDALVPADDAQAAQGPAPLAVRRKATRAERLALGMPMRCGILTVLVILSAFASIALLAPQDVELAPFGVFACVVLAGCAALFVWLDRVPSAGEIRGMRGFLALPDDGPAYVPQGGLLVGGVPVLYPLHWMPLVQADMGQAVDIELTEQGAVVRHGDRLSLDEETLRFMHRPWQPTAVIAGALVVLTIASLFFYAPLGARLDAARDALDGHRLVQIEGEQSFNAWQPQVGDELTLTAVMGDCAWLPAGSRVVGVRAVMHDCREVALDLPPGKPAMPALTASQQTAVDVSLALELMLQTRRNATPEEVREYWRLAGQGSSQRWTLQGVANMTQALATLCGDSACEARDVLVQAQSAPAARGARQVPDALILDAATSQKLAQAGFLLASSQLDPVMEAGIVAAQARHTAGARRLTSETPQPLASYYGEKILPDARDQTSMLAVGDQSPRLRMLRVAQALEASGAHLVHFNGAVRSVQAGPPQQVVVDTRVRPLPAWMKLAPVAAWLLLTLLALGAVLLTVAHRRRQRAQLVAIRRHYAEQVGRAAQ